MFRPTWIILRLITCKTLKGSIHCFHSFDGGHPVVHVLTFYIFYVVCMWLLGRCVLCLFLYTLGLSYVSGIVC